MERALSTTCASCDGEAGDGIVVVDVTPGRPWCCEPTVMHTDCVDLLNHLGGSYRSVELAAGEDVDGCC